MTDIVTVSDAQLVDTMKFFAERMKMMVEPTAASLRPPPCTAWCRLPASAWAS